MSIRKSLAYSFLDRYASLVITVASTMVLARLLTPNEVGAFSVTMVVISMMTTMRDLGAGQYLVQEKELTHDRIRAVWAVQLGLGVLMALAVLAASIPAGAFYADARVTNIMLVLALGYLVNPLGSVTYAWLIREMRYDATAIMRFASNVTNALTSIWLAWRGHGAISLAWGSLAGTVVNALVATRYRPPNYPWLPGTRELRRVLAFGSQLTLSSLADTLSKGSPEFFLGKFQDLAAAGFFSRANGLVAMFNRLVFDAAAVVAASSFAKLSREAQDTRTPFLVGMAHVTALCWSFAGALAFLASPVIRLLYGPQWETSADLVRWLAAALALAAPVTLCTAVLTGSGQAWRILRASTFSALVAIPLYLAGALHSTAALGVAAMAASAIATAYWLRTTRAVLGFTWSELAAACRRSLLVALAACVGPALVFAVYGAAAAGHTGTALLLGGGGAALGLLGGLALTNHPLFAELRRLFARIAPYLARTTPK